MDPVEQLETSVAGLGNESLLVALALAFALVSSSDAEIADEEVIRARDQLLRGLAPPYREAHPPKSVSPEKSKAIEAALRSLFGHMAEDFERGRALALTRIARFADSPPDSELIVSAAQAAIVADGKLRPREEVALRDVCKALGVDPSDR